MFWQGIIAARKEAKRPDFGKFELTFRMIFKCRLKPSQVASAVRFLAELDHRIVTTAAFTNLGFNVALELY